MEKTLKCIKCSQDRDVGRKMCRPCYLEHKRFLAKNRYKKYGRKYYQKTCAACKLNFEAWRKKQIFCSDCHKLKLKFAAESKSTNNYKNIGGKNLQPFVETFCWVNPHLEESKYTTYFVYNGD